MGRFKQVAYTFWWMLKSLVLKLTPARRILLLISLVLLLISHKGEYNGENIQVGIDTTIGAGLILLFILMLELKDKLLAHDELAAGRAVQAALMPEVSPSVPGWSIWLFTRTANEVGGDLVDFQKLDTSRFRISLADVAGKGLSAALFMAKLQATIRVLAPETDSLSELGTKINRIFLHDGVRNMFASLVCLELQPGAGGVRFFNAGHLPPLLMRSTTVAELQKGDAGIGLFPDASYTEQKVELQRGDVLIVYSDGVSDAKNEQGEFFGAERLLHLVPTLGNLDAREIGERIRKEVDNFVDEARVYDDLSLVVLKRKD